MHSINSAWLMRIMTVRHLKIRYKFSSRARAVEIAKRWWRRFWKTLWLSQIYPFSTIIRGYQMQSCSSGAGSSHKIKLINQRRRWLRYSAVFTALIVAFALLNPLMTCSKWIRILSMSNSPNKSHLRALRFPMTEKILDRTATRPLLSMIWKLSSRLNELAWVEVNTQRRHNRRTSSGRACKIFRHFRTKARQFKQKLTKNKKWLLIK